MTTTRPRRGVSVHIGLNRVDPAHYAGWSGELAGCEFDADDLATIASDRGFEARTILSARARADVVIEAIRTAGGGLVGGDVLFVTYSGHGSQLPDASRDETGATRDETDGRDETWALFDRQVLDDELAALWAGLAPGVRVLVLSDSCHSGSAVRAMAAALDGPGPFDHFAGGLDGAADPTEAPFGEAGPPLGPAIGPTGGPPAAVSRAVPKGVARSTFDANRATYAAVRLAAPPAGALDIRAHVLLLSGCQDDQESADGERNGLFTQTLLSVWDEGRFRGGHRTLWRETADRMPSWQQPNWFTVGPVSAGFHRSRPFTLRPG